MRIKDPKLQAAGVLNQTRRGETYIMSILIPNSTVFNYAEAGLLRAAYNSTSNEFYAYRVSYHFQNKGDFEKEARRLTSNWLTLILKSYNQRYKDQGGFEQLKELRSYAGQLNSLQLIKYLQCIAYNIELETIERRGSYDEDKTLVSDQDKKDVELLKAFIDDLAHSFINTQSKYQEAKWSD